MAKTKKGKLSFEESLARIDEVIELLESRGVSIEDSIALYEEAMNLAKECHLILESVEGRVKKIVDKKTKEMEEFNV